MRTLGSFGLVYMVDVDGYYVDELGTECDLRSGDAVWIHPGIAHAYGPKRGQAWTQIYVVFDGSEWERWTEEGITSPHQPVTHADPVESWARRWHDAFPAEAAPTLAHALRTFGVVNQLLLELLAAQDESSHSARDAWLFESQRLLGERSPPQVLSPQSVARTVGMSYENFRKKFSQHVGESPGHFQKRRRIEHACAAIYQGTHSFKALADELGFCDVFHFSKTFRQVVGETPKEFRAKAQGR
ncbi:AraC family transcriptional regulator [Opitutaceae bacterium]|nr:AraC family transcriptional regulator [Opitutaceae bacterium]